MAYSSTPVPIPESKKITFNKQYVLLTLEDVYDPAKKYNVRKKVQIGKKVSDGEMLPNDNYFVYFPSEDHLPEPDPDHDDTQKVGGVALVRGLVDKLSLFEKLSSVFGLDKTEMILDLATYMCLSGTSVMQHFEAWGYEHPLFSDTAVSDCTISRFLGNSISEKDIFEFFKVWTHDLDNEETLYINGDATNMNTDSRGIELAEYGYAKEDKSKKQVNIALAAAVNSLLPLFYDLYPGSYNDISEFPYLLRMAHDLGFENIGFVLDRGYFSRENLRDLHSKGYQMIMMLKGNNRCVREMIRQYGTELKSDWKNWIPAQGVYGKTVYAPLYKGESINYYCHIYYDERMGADQRVDLLEDIKKWEADLIDGIERGVIKADEASRYARYFNLEVDQSSGLVTGYTENTENIKEAMEECGFFVIASSEDKSAEEVILIYRNRDEVEKLFESIKTGLDCRRFRVHSDVSLRSKVFVVFIASIIRSQIYRSMKSVKGNDKKNYTVPAVIKELEKVKVIRQNDGRFVRVRKLTAEQKKLLKAVGVTEKEVDKIVK